MPSKCSQLTEQRPEGEFLSDWLLHQPGRVNRDRQGEIGLGASTVIAAVDEVDLDSHLLSAQPESHLARCATRGAASPSGRPMRNLIWQPLGSSALIPTATTMLRKRTKRGAIYLECPGDHAKCDGDRIPQRPPKSVW